MNNSWYLYNNEAVGVIAIISVLKRLKEISCAKALLILPLISHKKTLSFLKSNNTKVRSIEEFIAKKASYITNFNERYLSLLPISLNSILLLKEMGAIQINKNKLVFIEDKIDSSIKLGDRAADIMNSAEKLSILLRENADNLYLQLRVKL